MLVERFVLHKFLGFCCLFGLRVRGDEYDSCIFSWCVKTGGVHLIQIFP